MGLKLYQEADVQAIADAIRAKNGLTATYTISEMAQAITELPSGGQIKYTTLWRNQTPTAAISTMTVDFLQSVSDFDFIMISCRAGTINNMATENYETTYTLLTRKSAFVGATDNTYYYSRRIYCPTEMSMFFGRCYREGLSSASDGYCLPIGVYGAKIE